MSEIDDLLEDIDNRIKDLMTKQFERYFSSKWNRDIETFLRMPREEAVAHRITDLVMVKVFIENVVLGGENESGNTISPPGGRPG